MEQWHDIFADKFLLDLAVCFPLEWKQVAIHLDFSTSQIDMIDLDFQADGVRGKTFRMLTKFRDGSKNYGQIAQVDQLMQAFKKVGRMDLVTKIRKLSRSQSLKEFRNTGAGKGEPRSSVPSDLPQALNGAASFPIQESRLIDVDVKRWTNGQRYDELNQDTDNVYCMIANPRGYAVIINIMELRDYETRYGSQHDVQLLSSLFEQLHFTVRVEENLSADAMRDCLQEVSRDHALANHDCLLVCLMSHGHEDVIVGHDGKTVPLSELIGLFHGDKCPYLIDKPKVFFIQACRAGHSRVQSDGPGRDFSCQSSVSGLALPSLPPTSDIVIAQSCVKGYESYRNIKSGSWFIQALVEVLQKHACDEHLLDMLTRVTQKVSQLCNPNFEADNAHSKQCTEIVTTFRKFLYFFPGK